MKDKLERLGDMLRQHTIVEGNAYMLQMWRYVLQQHQNGINPANSERCDALPYLPAMPRCFEEITDRTRILDIGCLGSYGLFDVAYREQVAGRAVPQMVGIDPDPESVALARRMAMIWAAGSAVSFEQADAETFQLGSPGFDVVLCRLVLPYTRVHRVMANLARQMQSGNVLVLQVHSPAYYRQQFWSHRYQWRQAAYYIRPLLNGFLLAATGRQMYGRYWNETSITEGLLTSLARKYGFLVIAKSGFLLKPIFVLKRTDDSCGD